MAKHKSNMMSGTKLLKGDSNIPGTPLHKEIKEAIPIIEHHCRKMGLDYYPVIVELVTYDEMAELASYNGFPVRYPHWRFGMEYEEMSRGYEHNQYRISEMVINCLDLETMVSTDHGTIQAQSVKVGDTVFAGKNKPRKVVAVKKQNKKSTTKISIKRFGKDIVCSPNHKWRVMSAEGMIWKEAKDLVHNDVLIGDSTFDSFVDRPSVFNWTEESVIESTNPNNRKFLKSIYPQNKMTLELAELLGIVIGDGSCGVKSRENMISVVIDKRTPEYVIHVKDLFKKVFGVDAMVEGCRDNVDVVTICSKIVVDFFDYVGVPKGCTYKTKRVPWSILESSQEYRSAFLRGLFDTDGSAAGGDISFSCYNHDMACDVQLLLLEMGITCSCVRVDNESNNNISVIRVQGRVNFRKFQGQINFALDYKKELLAKLVGGANCTGSGIHVPFLQNKILCLLNKYQSRKPWGNSLRRSWNVLKKEQVGLNALVGVMDRYEKSWLPTVEDPLFLEIKELLTKPYFEVKEVCEWEARETIDIALDHDDHDFIASGFVTHNTNPCRIYCMDSNPFVDNVDVIAHAIGHNDFFKNNVFFSKTNTNMVNKMANHGTRIRKYMARWGYETVTEFIDQVLVIQTLIDPMSAWKKKKIKEVIIKDERNYRFPERLKTEHNYMDEWINPKKHLNRQKEDIVREEAAEYIDLFEGSVKDIFGYIKDNAPLKPWQQDIIAMLYEEAMYFYPQRVTKMINEGWASFVDYNIMCVDGLVSLNGEVGSGIWHYAEHKMLVLGGKYSQNPYKTGYLLFRDIEDRWNKGKFGPEWENCNNMHEKQNWNKNLGLGREKVFEVRKNYNDFTMISEFFTPEFCEKNKYFDYKKYPNGDIKIENRDFKTIKKNMLQRYLNGGLPDIRLEDPNHMGRGWFYLQHRFEGRSLEDSYTRQTMTAIFRLWKETVVLATANDDGQEVVYVCDGPNSVNVRLYTRKVYEKEFS